MTIRLDFRVLDLKSCTTLNADGTHNNPINLMWPVQTLTLLLCLTDEEQLYAQQLPRVEELPAIEAPAPAKEELPAATLELDLSC